MTAPTTRRPLPEGIPEALREEYERLTQVMAQAVLNAHERKQAAKEVEAA